MRRCIADLDLLIFRYPTEVIGHERLRQQFYFNNLLGNPFESAIAASHLIVGVTLDRVSGLDAAQRAAILGDNARLLRLDEKD